ncbi:MAG TPA: zf-TFIIB domain-containing protein [Candidatus Hydrogenedentes bacterium]|nr:zf-TFIIB domain-containing protein [Candidatus Hydrogenedentota bacterium]HPJ99207.1 zf-TFIIB domain-containing protein [Candidatus Hydrogenedentota bacterium]
MNCPACNEPMIGLEYDKVEVDYCLECAGVWLDEGELELLLGMDAPEVTSMISNGEDIAAGEAKRSCPACDRPMVKMVFGAENRVVYDWCPHNHGLFLDRGELVAILEHAPGFERGREISEFLRGIFTEQEEKPRQVPEA